MTDPPPPADLAPPADGARPTWDRTALSVLAVLALVAVLAGFGCALSPAFAP